MDVIPSHFGVGNMPIDDGDGLNNTRLRIGEVQAIYGKKHPLNIAKKQTEYSVFVAHRANGTAVTKMYEHCVVADKFASKADFFRYTLRADQSAKRKTTGPGLGAKVLILCANGESTNPIIICGVPDPSQSFDFDEEGHSLHFRFNGIDVVINKDGELALSYLGAQKADGTPAEGVDDGAVGTSVKISKDGNFKLADKDSKNVVLLDHSSGKIRITTPEHVVAADSIKHGSENASEHHVLGDKQNAWLGDFLTAVEKLSVFTGTGESSPPKNIPEFEALRARLNTLLSSKATVE